LYQRDGMTLIVAGEGIHFREV